MKTSMQINPETFEPYVLVTNGRRTIRVTILDLAKKRRPWMQALMERRLVLCRFPSEFNSASWL